MKVALAGGGKGEGDGEVGVNCQEGQKSESDVEGRREWRLWKRLCGMGWRGVGDGITINKTFSLNDVSLNGKSNTQISWVGLLIFEIYSLEKNFHFPFLA